MSLHLHYANSRVYKQGKEYGTPKDNQRISFSTVSTVHPLVHQWIIYIYMKKIFQFLLRQHLGTQFFLDSSPSCLLISPRKDAFSPVFP